MNREDVTALARRGVFTVEPWPVGKPLEEIVADLGLSAIALLATNENPLGASPRALEAMEEAIQRVNYYPGGPCVFLKRKLAGRLGVEENMVVFGNGADNCIRMVASAFLNEGEEVVLADPTFPVFSMFTRALGGVEVRVPLEGYVHDLEAMRQRVGPRTKLVYVCNPHNPTGSIVGRKEMDAFVRQLPPHVLLVIDEAYFEFVSDPAYPDGLEYVRGGHKVLVVRTFSKLYGLAGLRIGYMVADARLLEAVARVREPYAVSGVAQAAALAALDDREFVHRVLENNDQARELFQAELARLGLPFVATHTNFIFVDLQRDAAQVARRLVARGFMVRPGSPWGLPTCARITFGTEQQNRGLLAAREAVLGELSPRV